jgi:hypothetical protein
MEQKKTILYCHCLKKSELEYYVKEIRCENYELEIETHSTVTSFNRRVFFRKFIQNCMENKIQTLIVADLSIFGVNYSEIGIFLGNFLPLYGVRFISILENIDTYREDTDYIFTLERDTLSKLSLEIYPTEIHSELLKHSKKTPKMRKSSPYGYVIDIVNNRNLRPDPNSALAVKEIFNTYNVSIAETKKSLKKEFQGILRVKIWLKEQKIMRPEELKKIQKDPNHELFEGSFEWNNITITRILSNIEYLGHTVYSKKLNNIEKHYFFFQTHKALIDEKTFEIAQKKLNERNLPIRKQNADPLIGLLFCADCGKEMYSKKSVKLSEEKQAYVCGTYKNDKNKCKSHTISSLDLTKIIKKDVENVVKYVTENLDFFSNFVVNSTKNSLIKLQKKQQKLQIKYYDVEKKSLEKINEYWEKYRSEEISDLEFLEIASCSKIELKNLQLYLEQIDNKIFELQSTEKILSEFLKIVDKFKLISPLNFKEIIEKIPVHAVTEEPKIVRIDIYYKHIGQIDYGKPKPYFEKYSTRYGKIIYQISNKREEN